MDFQKQKQFLLILVVLFSSLILKTLASPQSIKDLFLINTFIKVFSTLVIVISFHKIINIKYPKTFSEIILLIISALIIASSIIHVSFNINLTESVSHTNHLLFLISSYSTGLFEELLFRIIIFKLVLRTNLLKAAHITSGLFAILHLSNLIHQSLDTYSVIIQIILAYGFGMLFQSIFIRFNSFILIATLHGTLNYLGTYKVRLSELHNLSIYHDYPIDDFIRSLVAAIILTGIILPISYRLITNKSRHID